MNHRTAFRRTAWVLAFLGSLCAFPGARAGSVEGPYIVWINLGSKAPEVADDQIRAFVNGSDRLCWDDSALLYMRKRPASITPALVRSALYNRNAGSQRKLRDVLRQPFDNLPAFDGLVAYDDRGEPKLWSFTVAGKVSSEQIRSATGEMAWGPTFCRLLPPIAHRP
jgi:hypothetical protein